MRWTRNTIRRQASRCPNFPKLKPFAPVWSGGSRAEPWLSWIHYIRVPFAGICPGRPISLPDLPG